MTDMSSGARAPDSTARQVANQTAQAAGQGAADVKDTATEQARRVAGEAAEQARSVAADVRDRVSEQAHAQHGKLVDGIRRAADELQQMRGDRQDSPAATVVSRVADSGRQFADYLDRNGPEGVLREVQDFARRRPGAFLAAALAAGFVVGRLGKGVVKANEAGAGKPDTDSFVSASPTLPETGYATALDSGYTGTGTTYPGSGTTYAGGTSAYPGTTEGGYAGTVTEPTAPGYPDVDPALTSGSTEYAATGTGTPVPVDETYAEGARVVDPNYEGGAR